MIFFGSSNLTPPRPGPRKDEKEHPLVGASFGCLLASNRLYTPAATGAGSTDDDLAGGGAGGDASGGGGGARDERVASGAGDDERIADVVVGLFRWDM